MDLYAVFPFTEQTGFRGWNLKLIQLEEENEWIKDDIISIVSRENVRTIMELKVILLLES